MRAALIVLACLPLIALGACDKGSSADNHLKAAGADAKAAVSDVGKAINSSVPDVKAAGAKLGDGIKAAGEDLKSSAKKAKDKIEDKG